MKLELFGQIFEKKYSNVKFHENPSGGSRVFPCEQTNTTKLTVAFRSFANAPNNWYFDGHFDYGFLNLQMEERCSSETSVNFNQTTRHRITDNSNRRRHHRCKNLDVAALNLTHPTIRNFMLQ